MACGSCQKRAQERLAKMKQQAELIKKMQSTPSEPARLKMLIQNTLKQRWNSLENFNS